MENMIETMKQRAKEQKARFIASMSDAAALKYISLYPAWKPDRACAAGERIRHNNWLYRVLQDHTAEAGKDPNHAPELYEALKSQ